MKKTLIIIVGLIIFGFLVREINPKDYIPNADLGPLLLGSLMIIILATVGVPVTFAVGAGVVIGLAVENIPFVKDFLF